MSMCMFIFIFIQYANIYKCEEPKIADKFNQEVKDLYTFSVLEGSQLGQPTLMRGVIGLHLWKG